MHHFEYRDGVLHAEDIPLDHLAGEVGTPFYCYSAATLRRHYSVFADAFNSQDTLVAFSVKSLSNIAVLSLLARQGAGADVVSGGELFRALKAGIPGEKIVFSGVGKTRAEMADALKAGICQFNVESEAELIALDEVARSMNVKAPIALRVNPDVAAGTHDKISTGRKTDKFGISWSIAADVYARAAKMDGIDVSGVDVHIGSQITDLAPFGAAFSKVAALVSTLRDQGHDIRRLDLGGGLGVPYHHQDGTPAPPHPLDYAKVIQETASHLDVQLIFEPGRMIAGNAGIMVARVTYLKENEGRHFAILDCGMNDLIRPALYDAWHDIIPITEPAEGAGTKLIDIVGPVCESTDRFARNREMPPLKPGDLVAFLTAGAYGAVQGNEYNTRPLVPEILVDGGKHAVIRRRPTYDEMIARETVPDWV
ncbi:diaminopimelate decarboxylase [Parvularcula flava]|uniref:Diaminopimelate decarboxylase n=1 Tax=Aquisalinus luteolus TaxID=1566827 RepID=A0A8J3A1L2_9PROT|nr:diaminopimelate decarboxylase [Aquisalinus luteolus]NHK26761.1 diaminopimelate decarboxylase [Aquisalinus luteolus]GGH93331.1 diaminopimelate decarboxylase [Aquisalinus luteolus]